MAQNDITFSDMYKLYFNQEGYDSTKCIKDITVTEHITKIGDDDTHVAMPFNICTDNCNIENNSIETLMNSSEVDVTIYPNIVFMKFPPNDLILKYNSTAQANGSVNVGNMKCEGDSPFNFEFQLVGMFIRTPPTHAFYIPNPSDPTFAIPNESIKAASILIYRSVCTPYIYIGTIINLEADDDYIPSSPNECLYQSILFGITSKKISLRPSKQSNLPLNKTKVNLQNILSNIENSKCETDGTNISLKDFMPEYTDDFYTWLDPYHREGLFWICYENRIKVNSTTLSQFAEAISDNNFWSNCFKSLNSRSVPISKQIRYNYESTPDNDINPNKTHYQITASVAGSNLSVDEISTETALSNKQDGLLDDVCSSTSGGTQSSDPVLVVNARSTTGEKMLIEVSKEGDRVLGSGGGVKESDITDLQKSIDELKQNLTTDDKDILNKLTKQISNINVKSGGSKTSSISTYIIWFFVIYLILTCIVALFIKLSDKTPWTFLATLFPLLSNVIDQKQKIELASNDVSNRVIHKIGSRLDNSKREISNMKNSIQRLVNTDGRNAKITELESDVANKNQQIDKLTKQISNPSTSTGPSIGSTQSVSIQKMNLKQLSNELESQLESQLGGYRKNKKIKRKAKIGYKRFRKSQL